MPLRVGWILVLVLAAGQAAWAKTEVLTLKFGSLPWAISESRTNVSDNKRIGQWIAIAIGATAGDYLIGRFIDTKETVITVAPEP